MAEPRPMFHVFEHVDTVDGRQRFEMLFGNVDMDKCAEYVRERPDRLAYVCEIKGRFDAEPAKEAS